MTTVSGTQLPQAVAYWRGYEIVPPGNPSAEPADLPSPIAFHYAKIIQHALPESLNSYHVLTLCERQPLAQNVGRVGFEPSAS